MNQSTVGIDGPDPAVSAAPGDIIENDWPGFLKKYMKELGWDNLDLAAESGIDRSQVSRWLRGEGHPRNDKLRQVCQALRVDVRLGIVAAGYFTPDDLRLRTNPREALRRAKHEQLLAECLRRMTGHDEVEPAAAEPAPGRGPFTEQVAPVVAPIQFQDGGSGRRNGRPA